MKKNTFFSIVFLMFLSSISLYTMIKHPKYISDEENRYLAYFGQLSEKNFSDGSFQDTLENALMDQFPKRNTIVQIKNQSDQLFRQTFLNHISETTLVTIETQTYPVLRLGNTDRLINTLVPLTDENVERAAIRAQQIQALASRHPNVNFYMYLPTQVHETDLFDAENDVVSGGSAIYQALSENLSIPHTKFKIETLDDYKNAYFMSDHHPNHVGANLIYHDILKLIAPNETALEPVAEDCHVQETFYGTFANRTGRITKPDLFCVYQYDLTPYEVSVNGTVQTDYKTRKDFETFNETGFSYYYNDAYQIYDPIMKITTSQKERGNLLVIGDSFSNSIIDLLASHYHETYRVAPYNVMIKEGHLFDYDTFIKENNIDTVLFMYTIENYYYQDMYGDRFLQNEILVNGGQ